MNKIANQKIAGRRRIETQNGPAIFVDSVVSLPDIWKNSNNTWSHCLDYKREWGDYDSCITDLRFSRETREFER